MYFFIRKRLGLVVLRRKGYRKWGLIVGMGGGDGEESENMEYPPAAAE